MSEAKPILQDIINDFRVEKFNRFFREKCRRYITHDESYERYNDDDFRNGVKLGELNFESADNLLVCAFEVMKPLSERVGKKKQYDKAKNILKLTENQKYNAGIFIFYDTSGNFRFSLIYPEAIGTRRQWSNFRRFTYFVSKDLTNKTFLQRIGNGNFSTLVVIKDAFSVEKVTIKFFEEFRHYFERTKKEFETSNKNTVCLWLRDKYSDNEYKEQINKFTYTFLGRIVFIYFLQRKGWIEGETNYLRKHIANKDNTLLYVNFFQPLFFDVFAKKENDRPPEIKKQYKDTPYLNGGLFEKSELENHLEEKGKFILFEDDFIRELILNYFEDYNFTIDENSPDDQEISIDPEMLGKVFENTLAEEERGKKGTFYTPREVVHFMVKDSLWQFLKNETMINPLYLHQLIYAKKEIENIGLSKEQVRIIDKKLENIKVLDPAVGSAAFPVEMMQILVNLRERLNVNVGRNVNEVRLKKQFIKNNLYGVDIDAGAIEIAKLRLWLALIVDYKKSEAEPLPNLDFQFRLGNSLQEKIGSMNIFQESDEGKLALGWSEGIEATKQEMLKIKDDFYKEENEEKKRKLKENFDDLEHQIILDHIKDLESKWANEASLGRAIGKRANQLSQELVHLKQTIKDGTYKLFKPNFHFSEVFDRKDKNDEKIGGFDIVIGNPPYGVKVDNDIKEWHNLGSKDSYGVFISTAMKRFLKPGGVLSFIVSDTWLTIKTHKLLRKQVLEKQLHKIIRVHQDCFDATVNACIISLTNSHDKNKKLITADLTNISTRKEIEDLRIKLYNINKFIGRSTPKFAVYEYNQDLIKTNSNLPIFVGSPKLFTLMNDTTCKTVEKEINCKRVKVRQIKLNDKLIELVRFGDIAEIKQGLATGDNKYYLFQNPDARGSYKNINDYRQCLLSEKDLEKIKNDEKLRLKVIEKGFYKSKNENDFDEDLWFDGRYIVPYDKGGESDTDSGWLPNYYVPTNYFIDWSQEAVTRMRTLTIRQRDGMGNDRICSRFQNTEYYFKIGITYSPTGVYAPTFRYHNASVFDKEGSCIFCNINELSLNGLLSSKIIKYFQKIFINGTVHSMQGDVVESPTAFSHDYLVKLMGLVKIIIEKQKQNPRYNYMSSEQKEIDKIVYEMYGLNKDDIREVETWYARRYPKLARFCDIE